MVAVLTEFINLLVGGVNAMATGIAGGISAMASGLFLDTTGSSTTLSVFGGIIGIFCGVALAVGITTRVFLWVTSLGNN